MRYIRTLDLQQYIKLFSSFKLIERLTSIPTCRKTLCAKKNNRYFDFKHLKIYAHFNISYKFFISIVPWPLLNTPKPSY